MGLSDGAFPGEGIGTRLMAEYELWPGFVRRCTKLTKLPSAEPSSDMISLACNR